MMDLGPLCYIQRFMEIGPMVPEKIFDGVLPYMGHGSHLGHVTNIILTYFHFLVRYLKDLVENGPVVSEKSKF